MLTAADANITALTRQRAVHFNYDPFLVGSRIGQAFLRSD
jgi:hypothetical protein